MKKVYLLLINIAIILSMNAFGVVDKNNKGVELIRDSLFSDAQKNLELALEKDKDNPTVNYNMGLSKIREFEEYKNKDSLTESLPFFEKSAQDTSETLKYLSKFNMGNVFYNSEDYANAINTYQEAATSLDTTKTDVDLVYNMANSLYKFGENNKEYDSLITHSGKMYSSLLNQVSREDQANILHNMGNVAMKGENYKDAISNYYQALSQNPEDDETRKNYEIALRKLEAQEQQQQENKDSENNDEKSEEQKQEEQKSDSQKKQEQQQKEEQQKESEKKQEEYKDMSKEEKEKMDAEKKLDALIQQQSQDNKDKQKPTIRKKNGYSGRFW